MDIQVVLNVNWNSSPSQNEIDLQMNSVTDLWVVRFTISDSPVPVSTTCSNQICNSSAFATAQSDKNIRVRIQSTTEANFSLTPFRHDALRSRDEFEYFSDGAVNNPDYFGMHDLVNGLYVGPNARQLESWILERNILATDFDETLAANTQAFIDFLESGNATIDVQEYFLNSLQQISYLKYGTATVSSVMVITQANNPYPLECKYEVVSDWGTGYQSNVNVKNVSNKMVNGWLATLDFKDAVYIDSYWNSEIKGYIPHAVATPASWNDYIYPGQEVNFGFVGSKAPSQVASAKVDSKLCR